MECFLKPYTCWFFSILNFCYGKSGYQYPVETPCMAFLHPDTQLYLRFDELTLNIFFNNMD